MNVLLIGDADDHWTLGFIEEVLIPRGDSVVLVTISNKKNAKKYEEYGINVIETRDERRVICRIKYLKTLVTLVKTLRAVSKSDADAVIYIYPSWFMVHLFKFLRNRSKLIYYYIGSDLMRVSKRKLRFGKAAIRSSKNVAFNTIELSRLFYKAYGDVYCGQSHVINFGMSKLSVIDKNSTSIPECRKEYLSEDKTDKILVAIGYNARCSQQVDFALTALNKLPESVKNKIKILIPMQYGGDDQEYLLRVEHIASSTNIETEIIKEYYNENQVAVFVKAVDIFINSQTTDALAAAVIEQLYAGSLMINAEWLKYEYLDDIDLFYLSFDGFQNLADIVYDAVEKIDYYREKAKENHIKMIDKFTWQSCKDAWDGVLASYGNKNLIS